MNREFQSLHYSNDGYIVKCKQCRHYQLAFMCLCITIHEEDFPAFRTSVAKKTMEHNTALSDQCKCIMIKTPVAGACFLLTHFEAIKLHNMLEEADVEEQTLSMLDLFNPCQE
ncbi:MAG TPA: DUF6686 family protein [Phnomibacter sp.]|nr:DUF6686 family protein [Phnomibacter sp.]